ncbi:hypothetical protein Taro_024966 [Colocasia esculenta]|uniref:Uncharacterized protein n=1 Tax=Colocasia esculenta TaxID=4460 RepID=A0A843V8X3_COLES|nr:hypothetical protein [Colocasia esculenta]
MGEVAVAPSVEFPGDFDFWWLVRKMGSACELNPLSLLNRVMVSRCIYGMNASLYVDAFLLCPIDSHLVIFENTSSAGYPRFLGEPGTCVVLGVCPGIVCTGEVCVVFLDTLTPVFELELGPESLKLDLSSVIARLRGGSCAMLSGLDTGVMNQYSVPVWWRRSFPAHVLPLVLACVEVALCFVEVSCLGSDLPVRLVIEVFLLKGGLVVLS